MKNMLNYVRRERQADENSNIIIEKFAKDIKNKENLYPGTYHVKNDNEFNGLVKKIQIDIHSEANNIQPDWSIPIVLESIGKMYYGLQTSNQMYGPAFKRALVYLWKTDLNGLMDKKNLDSLLKVIKLSFVLEVLYGLKKFYLLYDDFYITLKNGYCTYDDKYSPHIIEFSQSIQGRGKRMRIAAMNSQLMNNSGMEFYHALLEVLNQKMPSDIPLFKGTFYEKIPDITNRECKTFWQSVFFMYVFYLSAIGKEFAETENKMDFNPSVTIFPEFGLEIQEGFFTQEIAQAAFWNKKWLDSQDEDRYGNLIVERPILRITPYGDFATCSVLIGDSINYFIEGQILNYTLRSPKINLPPSIFKDAISAPFEDKVINDFRTYGFLSGHVSEHGIWGNQNEAINLNWNKSINLYGEIDAFAYIPDKNLAILVECKVLNDVRDYRSYKNILSKIVDDSEGFRKKLLEKSKWINQALSNYYNIEVTALCVILTDIPIPIPKGKFSNHDIVFTYYNDFFERLEEFLNENRV